MRKAFEYVLLIVLAATMLIALFNWNRLEHWFRVV
jgi:hypothetical protein